MSEDIRVKGRTNREVREIAKKLKRFSKVDASRPVNIIRCLEAGIVETERGRKRLIFHVLPDQRWPTTMVARSSRQVL